MEISIATIKDIPTLCLLLSSLFEQELEFKADTKVQTAGLAAIINNPVMGDILVARESGEIVGMLSLLYTISTALGGRVALLEDMVVSSKMQNQGIGSKLIKQAINFAKTNGCKRINLLTDEDNNKAHNFYQQQGFKRSSMLSFRLLLKS